MNAYRITKRKHAARAVSGDGAEQFGGRFNSPGRRAVYCSRSISLALLELLAHVGRTERIVDYVIFRVNIPEDMVENVTAEQLPEDWNRLPVSASAQAYGDAWLTEKRSAALLIPSVLVPEEQNVVLNPEHPAFHRISFAGPEPISLDARLI